MIISFSKSFNGLKRLVLYRASKLTDAAIDAIVEYCPELETLPLGGWDLLTDKTLKALAQLTSLKALHLTGNQGYTNSSIIKDVRNNHCIEKLILTFSKGALYDSTVFRQITEYCNNLRLLKVDISPALAPSAIPSLLLADEDLIPLIRSCPLLESVSINGTSRLTEMILLELSTHCRLLFSLELRSCSPFARDPPLVTDDSIAAISMGCPKLDTLTLGPCMEITDQGIISIAKHCKRLTHLSLEYNDKITDAGMRVLFESSTLLTAFDGAQLSNLTDESMIALPAHCPQLSSLALSRVPVTEAFLRSLAKHCPKLAELNLHCFTFAKKAYYTLRPLLLQCPALTTMQFNMCPGFTSHTLINLLTRHSKQLKYLTILDCLDLVNEKSLSEFMKTVPPNLRLVVEITESAMMTMALMAVPQYHYYYELEEEKNDVEVEEVGVLGEEEVVD